MDREKGGVGCKEARRRYAHRISRSADAADHAAFFARRRDGDEGHPLDQSFPRSASRRSLGTIITASAKIRRDILLWPARRSTKTIGTSTTSKPLRIAR